MANKKLLTDEEYLDIASLYLGSKEVQVEDVNIGPLDSGIAGFMGEYSRISITILDTNKKERHVIHCFSKKVPTSNPEHTEYVVSMGAYQKECVAYSSILPRLKSCLASGVQWFAEPYLIRSDLLVLENLAVQGYSLHDGLKCMDTAHIYLVLTKFAHFHAASVIFEQENGSIQDVYKDVMYENLFTSVENSSSTNWLKAGMKAALYMLDFHSKYGKGTELHNEVKGRIIDSLKQIWEFVKPSHKYRNVLCHGDIWNNNIMFKYENQKPVEVKFVDFQMYRYTPPVCDIVFFLYMTTRRAFREAHIQEFLVLYYKTFSEELRSQGYNAQQLLAWSELTESYEVLRDFGRTVSVLCNQLCLMNGDYVAPYITNLGRFKMLLEQNRNKQVEENFMCDSRYRHRFEESMEEFIEFNVLKNRNQ